MFCTTSNIRDFHFDVQRITLHTNVKIQYTRGARLNVQPQHSFMQEFLTDGYIQNEQMLNNRQRNTLVWIHAQ